QQRDLELLGEETLAADLGERPVLDLVATGSHADQLDQAGGIALAQQVRHVLCLPERKPAFPGRNPELCGAGRRARALRGRLGQLTSPLTMDHWRRLTGSRSGTSRRTTCQ